MIARAHGARAEFGLCHPGIFSVVSGDFVKEATRPSLRPKRWAVRKRLSLIELKSYPDLHPLVVQLLGNRGISGLAEIERFLAPDKFGEPPQELADANAAVERILRARDCGEKVAIHGDYDADGVTGSVILFEEFRRLGIDPIVYIPLRSQGYGMSQATVGDLARQGVSLIVTVDCGVTAHAEIEFANHQGIEVIVTDHHQVLERLPPALAVIHPNRPGQEYRYEDLAGSGVAMMLVGALRAATGAPAPWDDPSVMELVALGTVADVVRLTGENRSLVTRGLEALRQTSRPGLLALCETARVRPASIDSSGIGFILAPRLNAAGRLRDARLSFDLLATNDASTSRESALELEQLNRRRQKMMNEAAEKALEEVAQLAELPSAIVVSGDEYDPGIAGLVAAKLVEHHYRPAVVIAVVGDTGRASARSIEGFDIAQAISECGDLLSAHGGHAMAAGFSIKPELIDDFVHRFQYVAESHLTGQVLEECLDAEALIRLDLFELKTFDQISRIEPFGHGNPAPYLVAKDLEIRSVGRVGREDRRHLRLDIHDGRRPWKAMWFGKGHLEQSIPPRVDLMFTFQPNTWNGLTELRLNVVDLRAAGYSNSYGSESVANHRN